MTAPWFERDKELLEDTIRELRSRHPNLHLFLSQDGSSEIRGTMAIRSPAGRVLDRYRVTISIPPDFPKTLPEVREVGGRIPWEEDLHVEKDGRACVMLPDERWRVFPDGSSLVDFVDGPVHSFFLGQSLVELGEDWPFGEWGHGTDGIWDYYKELIETDDTATVVRYLRILRKRTLKKHWRCPCGSGKKIRQCCEPKVKNIRSKVAVTTAREACQKLGFY